MLGRKLLSISMAAMVSGCAYVTAVPYDDPLGVDGIKIPEQIPLLVVTGTSTNVIYATNPNKGTAIQFGAFLAKHDFNAKFNGGTLSEIASNQDTTALALKLVELVNTAAQSGNPIGAAFSGKSGDGGGTGDRFGVFKFVFDTEGNFVGFRPVLHGSDLMKVAMARQRSATPIAQNGTRTIEVN
ncbi:hypothetical protein [Roseibium sp.]|uniref:hypothetical protein n=1 Tax=Roseibium sp. TaxID=1936156 RepID=UPI00391B8C56